jgi:N(2)-fixation sustaining protein CowN
MTCSCKQKNKQPDAAVKLDRYVSFIGLDCDAKATRLVELIHAHIDKSKYNAPFWEYFKKKAAGSFGPRPDNLLLIHSHLNEIRELFEQIADTEGMNLLDQLEQECC